MSKELDDLLATEKQLLKYGEKAFLNEEIVKYDFMLTTTRALIRILLHLGYR